jgi:hypothetical protein
MYFDGSPKFISKWLYTDEKELKALNYGATGKENSLSLLAIERDLAYK